MNKSRIEIGGKGETIEAYLHFHFGTLQKLQKKWWHIQKTWILIIRMVDCVNIWIQWQPFNWPCLDLSLTLLLAPLNLSLTVYGLGGQIFPPLHEFLNFSFSLYKHMLRLVDFSCMSITVLLQKNCIKISILCALV